MRDEVGILRRYSDLTAPYFKVLRDHLDSEKKEDRRWAAEQLKNAFIKMIPQEASGEAAGLPFTLIIKPKDG